MEVVNSTQAIGQLKDNSVLMETEDGNVNLENTKICFKGRNNILYLEDGVHLKDSTIIFEADNSVVYLSKNKNKYLLNVTLNNNNALFIGQDNYMNGKLNIVLSEQKHVLIGNRCLFSFGIWIRLADPHLIYDSIDKGRINFSKSVFLGDHVWISQSAMILKGTKIGSGSIVGAMSLVAGKEIPSNTSWAGNPARKLRDNVFFTGDCVHKYKEEQTEKSRKCLCDEFIYSYEEGKTKSFLEIDRTLSSFNNAEEMLKYLQKEIRGCKDKNRFYIPQTSEKAKKTSLFRKNK